MGFYQSWSEVENTCREPRGMALVWESERSEKAFWRVGRAPVAAANDSASRCAADIFPVEDDEDCPIIRRFL